MVGLIVEEQFLPLYSEYLAASGSTALGFGGADKFKDAQAAALIATTSSYKLGRFQDVSTRGVISSISDFIRTIKNNEQGNASLQDVENLRERSSLLSLKWRSRRVLTMVMSDGTIVHLTLKNLFTQQVIVNIDKSLRHNNDLITHVAYAHGIVLFLFEDNRLVIARTIQRQDPLSSSSPPDDSGSGARGSSDGSGLGMQPEVTIDTYTDFLPHLAYRRLDKTVSLNQNRDLFLVWWPASKDDVFPWSPKPEDRANILIYQLDSEGLGGGRFEGQGRDVGEGDAEAPSLVSFLKTDHKLLDVSFLPNPNVFSTLEEEVDAEGKIVMVEIFYDILTMTRESETAIPVQSEITCFAYDIRRSRLAFGSCDSSLVIYSQQGRITLFTKTAFIPVSVAWHPDSFLVFVAGDRGQYQVFDIALSPLLLLQFGDVSPSVTKEFLCCGSIKQLLWSPWPSCSCDSNLLIEFDSGPMIILRFGFGRMGLVELVNYYLSNGETGEAIKVLKSVYWGSQDCLTAIFNIFTRLIRASHSDSIEHELETLLAIYFVPTYAGDDALRKKHAKSMRVLARKFFMWLLMAGKFQRAFQIAVSLGESGLFQKLHDVAVSKGEREVASSALGYLTPPPPSSDGSSTSSTYDDSYSSDGSGRDTEGESCSCHSSSCSSHHASSTRSPSSSHSSRTSPFPSPSQSPSPSPSPPKAKARSTVKPQVPKRNAVMVAEKEEGVQLEVLSSGDEVEDHDHDNSHSHHVVVPEVIEDHHVGPLRVLPLPVDNPSEFESRYASSNHPPPLSAHSIGPVGSVGSIGSLGLNEPGDFEEYQRVGGNTPSSYFTSVTSIGSARGGLVVKNLPPSQEYRKNKNPTPVSSVAAAASSSDIEVVHFGLV